jgi:DHA1 family tetracycline resistance protein-like MFS transporter
MTDLTDESSRAQGMGVIGAASGIGLVLGTALGGLLGSIDPALPFHATAAVAGLNFLLAAFALPESKAPVTREHSWRGFAHAVVPEPLQAVAGQTRKQVVYLFLFLQIFFAFSAIESMFPLFAHSRFLWDERKTGLFMAAIAIVLGGSQLVIVGPLSRLWGERMMTTVGLALTGGSIAGLSACHSIPALTVCSIGVALGAGIAFPAFTSLFSKVCSAQEQGAAMSRSQAMIHLGRALGASSWGLVFATAGAGPVFFFAGLALLAALGVFLASARVLLHQP